MRLTQLGELKHAHNELMHDYVATPEPASEQGQLMLLKVVLLCNFGQCIPGSIKGCKDAITPSCSPGTLVMPT